MALDEVISKNGKASTRNVDERKVTRLVEHIVEIISDSGEGAQKCGQSLGSIVARMGLGVWTVEIIPAEIRPPARSVAGASGNRIRIAPSDERRQRNGPRCGV
jgi:2-oxoglutarate ferredoxin oxidoreductase subunit alpha